MRGAIGALAAMMLLSQAALCEEPPTVDIDTDQSVLIDQPIAPVSDLPVKPDPTLEQLVNFPADDFMKKPKAGTFLEKGEYCYQDQTDGVYIYVNDSVHIRITRYQTETPLLTWHEAEIWTRNGELVKTVGSANGERDQDVATALNKIALEKNIVLGISTDFVHTRRKWGQNAGVMIREGVVLNDRTYAAGRVKYPNNDNLALFANGEMHVYPNATYTAQEFLDIGAYDVFSFGPILVKDGVKNSKVIAQLKKEAAQRIAVGIFEKGHYLMVMCEGRHSGSKGANLSQLADIFVERGVREAFNMDGGQSSVMTFMGETIFYTSAKQQARNGSELLAVGTSALVGR